VEALLKNHDRFEKLMEQQIEQVEDVRQFAAKLETQNHYAWDEIKERKQAVEDRYKRLKDKSSAKRTKLGDSNKYQLFLRTIYEVFTSVSWKHLVLMVWM
jgi:spectrin alpha